MDSYSSPENLFGDRNQKLLQGLIQGLESVNQLRNIIGRPVGDDKSSVAADLARRVSESLAESISIVKRCPIEEVFDKIQVNSPHGGLKSEDSDGSCKSTSILKQRRGCYKRRRTTQTWTTTTSNLIDDGHAWRKYGQKLILNASHPRNYYRCTHKFDQGCQATKQVQRTEEEPPMYQITYHGNHSCRDPLKAPHIILDSTIPNDTSNSNFISFGSTHYPNTKLNHEPSYPTFPVVKREYSHNQHELKPSLNHNQSTLPTDPLVQLPDSMVFDSSVPMPASSPGSDHSDVISSSGAYSRTSSTHDDSFDGLEALVDFDVSQFVEFCY